MISFEVFLECLGSSVIKSHLNYKTISSQTRIILLEKGVTPIQCCIYIGSAEVAASVIESFPKGSSLILEGQLPSGASIESLNVVEASLPVSTIYNQISDLLQNIQLCNMNLCLNNYEAAAEQIMRLLHTKTVYFLDSSYHLIYASHQEENPTYSDVLLMNNCRYIRNIVDKMSANGASATSCSGIASDLGDNIRYQLYILRENSTILGYCLLLSPQGNGDTLPLQFDIVLKMCKKILRAMSDHMERSDRGLGLLINDFVHGNLTSSEEILRRAHSLNHPVKNNYAMIVVKVPANMEQSFYHAIIDDLKSIFPGHNIGRYCDDVVVLYTTHSFVLPPDLNQHQANQLLERYDSYMGISNCVNDWNAMDFMLNFAEDAVNMGRKLSGKPGQRIFTQQENIIYHVFDMYTQHFFGTQHYSNIKYVFHPHIITLMIYDRQHNDNLLAVLRTYLKTGKNIMHTANSMYMHRNTVTRKLKQITELIDDDLSSSNSIFQFMLSFYLLDYLEDYLGYKIQIPTLPDEAASSLS